MAEIIQQEVSRILKNKRPARMEQVNFAQLDEFAGNIFKTHDDLPKWIIRRPVYFLKTFSEKKNLNSLA